LRRALVLKSRLAAVGQLNKQFHDFKETFVCSSINRCLTIFILTVDVYPMLIEKGAGFEIPTSGGRTALYNVSMNRYTEIVRLLLDHRVNVDCQNKNG
jgi:ankyrin repeat protein